MRRARATSRQGLSGSGDLMSRRSISEPIVPFAAARERVRSLLSSIAGEANAPAEDEAVRLGEVISELAGAVQRREIDPELAGALLRELVSRYADRQTGELILSFWASPSGDWYGKGKSAYGRRP